MTPNPSISPTISAIQYPCTHCRTDRYCLGEKRSAYSNALAIKQKKEYTPNNGNCFQLFLASSVMTKNACKKRPASQRCRAKILIAIFVSAYFYFRRPTRPFRCCITEVFLGDRHNPTDCRSAPR